MRRLDNLIILGIGIFAGAIGFYWLEHRSEPIGTEAAAEQSPSEKEGRKILYYRNPMGHPDTSPVPKKDSMGMDYIPVYADEVDDPDYIPQFLWKLFIDQRYQGRGYGSATLDLIVERFRGNADTVAVTTSAGQGEGSPIGFYERYGFQRTGELHGDEVVLRLPLA